MEISGISVLHKVPGSDKIVVEKLDSAVKEVLENFDLSKENEDTAGESNCFLKYYIIRTALKSLIN